jgi:hypothetical protein
MDCYESLTTRDEPIDVEEGVKLGLRTSLQIARAREMSRGPDTGGARSPSAVQVKGLDLRLLISNIFQFPLRQTDGADYAGPLTAPVRQSNRVDRASALPAVSDVDFSVLRVPMTITNTFVDGPHHTIKTRSPFTEQLEL